MAGEWIPIEIATPRKTELARIARATGRSLHETLGLIVAFWCWVSVETEDGHIDATVDELCLLVGGDPGFWDSVMKVGWLAADGETLQIPRADHWLTKGAKARLRETRRKQVQRSGVPDLSQPEWDKSGTTEQNRTEDNRTEQTETFSMSLSKDQSVAGGSVGTTAGKDQSCSVFRVLQTKHLSDIGALKSWLQWQAGEATKNGEEPVLNPSDDESLVKLVAAAEISLKRGKKPVAYLASLIGRDAKISKDDMKSARKRVEVTNGRH